MVKRWWHIDGEIKSGDLILNATRRATGETVQDAMQMIIEAANKARGMEFEWVAPPTNFPHLQWDDNRCPICAKREKAYEPTE